MAGAVFDCTGEGRYFDEQVEAIMRTDSTFSFWALDEALVLPAVEPVLLVAEPVLVPEPVVAEPVAPLPYAELELELSSRPLISTSCPTWFFNSLVLPSRTYWVPLVPLMLDPDVPLLAVVPLVALPVAPVVAELEPLPMRALARMY
jgi:hypothetical protein